jgi:hypothetical protein
MRKPTAIAQLLLVALLIATGAITALAQNNKGAIVGTVKDPNDALVSKAQVKVTSVTTAEVRTAETNDEGVFTVTNLDPGMYNVTVEATGFQSVTVQGLQVETNARAPLDVKFSSVTAGNTSVTITAESAPLVESETSVRGDLITGREVTDLPIPQRNFTLLAGLSPGVTRPNLGLLGGGGNFVAGGGGQNNTESTRFRESGGSVLVVNGARATNNNFTLDGVDNNESQFGQIAIYPNPDAIAEFKIESSVASAESGRAGGGIISTTFKSGGNDFHGTVGEIYQGRLLSAAASRFVGHRFTTVATVRSSSSRLAGSATVRRSSAAPAIRRQCLCLQPECASAISVSCSDPEPRVTIDLLEAGRYRRLSEPSSLPTEPRFRVTIFVIVRAVARSRRLHLIT